jgi:hypothetical protein
VCVCVCVCVCVSVCTTHTRTPVLIFATARPTGRLFCFSCFTAKTNTYSNSLQLQGPLSEPLQAAFFFKQKDKHTHELTTIARPTERAVAASLACYPHSPLRRAVFCFFLFFWEPLLAVLIHSFIAFFVFGVDNYRIRRTGRKVLSCLRARHCLGGNLCLNPKLNSRPQTPEPQS